MDDRTSPWGTTVLILWYFDVTFIYDVVIPETFVFEFYKRMEKLQYTIQLRCRLHKESQINIFAFIPKQKRIGLACGLVSQTVVRVFSVHSVDQWQFFLCDQDTKLNSILIYIFNSANTLLMCNCYFLFKFTAASKPKEGDLMRSKK